MRKDKALKALMYVTSAALFLSMPTLTARAENVIPTEQGIAGIAFTLENYYAAVQGENGTDNKELTNILATEIISPYANLGVSKAESFVNVRSEPSIDSKVVGKLYRGCAADILEYLDGDWVKIESGDVKGYIASNFLSIGHAAEVMVDKYATKYATVDTATLNVREKQSTDSKILTQIPQGEAYIVVKEHDEWLEILLGNDDSGGDFTGFVSKELVILRVDFKYAISIEEENRILKEQEEAERAEAERKVKLSEAAAKKAEEERNAAKAKNTAQESNKSNNSSETKVNSPSSGSSANATSLHGEIISYAQKFVGNRYVWGGTSLTNGADCSGFVQSIYKGFGYYIPRVSRDQAASAGIQVNVSDRQPGDLIFYTNSSGSVNHVAMYIGNNRIVHAANSRQGIITSQYNYRDIYRIRRIIY